MPHPENVLDKQWPKGVTGNPKGRPKGSRHLSTVLKEMMSQIAPETVINAKFVREFCRGKKRVTIADAMAARIITEAIINGESWAMKEIADRTEGKAAQPVEMSGEITTNVRKFSDAVKQSYGDGD